MNLDSMSTVKTAMNKHSYSKNFLMLIILILNILKTKSDQTAIFGGAFGDQSDIGYTDKTGYVLNTIIGSWNNDYLLNLQTRIIYIDPVSLSYGSTISGFIGATAVASLSSTNDFQIYNNEHINIVQLYMGMKTEGYVVNGVRFITNTARISNVFGKAEGCNFLIFLHGRLISFAGRSNSKGIVSLRFNYFPYTSTFLAPECEASCTRYCGNFVTQCASTTAGYFMLKATTGETQCEISSPYIYESKESKIYQKCQLPCATCSTSSTTCLTCSKPQYLPLEDRQSSCIAATSTTTAYQDITTNKYYFKDSTNLIYKLCDNSCLQCTDSAKKCSNCRSGFIRRENDSFSCLADAKSYFDSAINKYYYRDVSGTSPTFRECRAPCVACEDSATNCVGSCNNALNFFRLEDKATCVETTSSNVSGTTVRQYYDSAAKQGYYLDTSANPQILRKCYSSCEKCLGKGDAENNNCDTCAQGYNKVFYNQKNCFNGSELFHYFDSNDKFYKKCFDTCKTCSALGTDVNNNCKTCKDGLVADPISIGMCRGNLESINKDGYFLNTQTGLYEKCGESCKTCDKGANTIGQSCKTCKDGTFLKNPAKDPSGNCFQGNLEGFYLNKNASYYDNCFTNCKTCDDFGDINNNNCVQCAENYVKLNDNPKMCFSFLKPPKGYFYDETAKNLAKCPNVVSTMAASGTSSTIRSQIVKILTVIPNRFDTKTKRKLEIRFSDSIIDENGLPIIKEVYLRTNNSPKYKLGILASYCNYISVNFDPAEALKSANFNMRLLEETEGYRSFDSKLIRKYYQSARKLYDKALKDLYLNKTYNNSAEFNEFNINIVSNNSQIRNLQTTATNSTLNPTSTSASISATEFREGEYEIIVIDKFNNEISSKLNNIAINIAQTKIDTILTNDNSQLISSMKIFLAENTNFDPIILKNPDNSVVAIYNLSDSSVSKEKEISVQNGISFFEFSECLNILMSFYNYTNSSDLVAIKLDQAGSTSQTSSASYKTGFTVLDRQGKKLDLSPCDKTTVKTMIPIKTDSPINLTLASEFEKNENASIYDPNAAFYNDMCFSFADNETDLSLNNRRKSIYPNVTIQCSTGCNFTGLDTSIGYSQCSCDGSALDELSVQYISNAMDVLVNNNLKLIVCVEKVFETKKLISNYAFYFTIVLLSLIALEMLIFCIYPCINKKTIKGIIESDGSYLDYLRVQEINRRLAEDENENLNNLKKNEMENENDKIDFELVDVKNKNLNSKENENKEMNKVINPKNEEENINEKTNLNPHKNKNIKLSIESYDLRESEANNNNNLEILNKEGNAVLINNHIVKDGYSENNKNDAESNINKTLNNNNTKILNESKLKENLKRLKSSFAKNLVLIDKDEKEKQRNIIDVIAKEKLEVDIPEDIDSSKFLEKDYEEMSFEELKRYDKRSFATKVFIQIKHDNPLASLIFKRSLIHPLHLAIFCFLFDFYVDCGANAIFYSDEYITHNYENKNKSFVELFFWGLPKSLYAGLFCVLLGSLVRIFIQPPNIMKKEISVVCINENIAEIRYSYSRFMKIMRKRYIIYFTISTILLIFFGIFMICFCGTYRMSQAKWMIGSVTTLIYRLAIIKILLPVLKVSLLTLALKKDLRKLFKVYVVLNYII